MKKAFLFLFLMLPGLVFADQLLQNIQASITTAPIMRGSFKQTRVLSGVSKQLNSEGFFLVDKERGILWVTEKPIYQILKVTPSEINIKNKNQTIMNINAANEPSMRFINELLMSIFSGDMSAIEKVFIYQGEININGWSLLLTQKKLYPTTLGKVSIRGKSAIEAVSFESKDGDLTRITFTDVKPVRSLTKDEISQFQ